MIGYTNFDNERMTKILRECVEDIGGRGCPVKVREYNGDHGPTDSKYMIASFDNKKGSLKLIKEIYFHGYWKGHNYAEVKSVNPVMEVTLIIPGSTTKKIQFESSDCEKEFKDFILPILRYISNREILLILAGKKYTKTQIRQ